MWRWRIAPVEYIPENYAYYVNLKYYVITKYIETMPEYTTKAVACRTLKPEPIFF